VIVAEGCPAQVGCRVLGVSESGSSARRRRAPSSRTIRHAWLTDMICRVHADSRGTYGARRVHAELTVGRAILVGHGAVELLMRRAGIQGLTGRPAWRRGPRPEPTAVDLVDRQFARTEPNQLWVTDIVRHEALFDRG
jgi:putative transposase